MCVTRPGRILEIEADGRWAAAATDQGPRRVSLDLLVLQDVPVRPGDWVLINTGAAVDLITEREAQDLLDLLNTVKEEAS